MSFYKKKFFVGNGCGYVFFLKKIMGKCIIVKFLFICFNMVYVYVYFYDVEVVFEFMVNWNILKKNCIM